jgi:hypothetical protein
MIEDLAVSNVLLTKTNSLESLKQSKIVSAFTPKEFLC